MIIHLESPSEEVAAEHLSSLVVEAMENPNEHLISFLRGLWDNESWESIVRKFSSEGSTWYVWWQDGVKFFIEEHNCNEKLIRESNYDV